MCRCIYMKKLRLGEIKQLVQDLALQPNIAAHWWGRLGRENCLPSTVVLQLKRYSPSYFINQPLPQHKVG